MVGVHVEDELTPAAKDGLAFGKLFRRRQGVAASRGRPAGAAGLTWPALPGAGSEVDRREERGHPAGGLQEQPPVHGQRGRGCAGPAVRGPGQPGVPWTGRGGQEFAVRYGSERDRQPELVVARLSHGLSIASGAHSYRAYRGGRLPWFI